MKTRLTRRGKLAGGLGLLLALTLVVTLSWPVLALPQQPHQFWGSVSICADPVEEGTEVSARIDGEEYATTTVDAEGRYGYASPFYVPADDPETPDKEGGVNDEWVEFYVLDKLAGQAQFEIWGYTLLDLVITEAYLTVNANPPGSGVVTGEGLHDCDTLAPISADPGPGWDFVNWTGTGITNPGSASTTVLIDGDKTVTANFSPIGETCDLTVLADPADCGVTTGSGTYACGSTVPISVDPDACCEFVNWTGTGITDPGSVSTTVLVDVDKTVTANLNRLQYTLTVLADPVEGGDVTGGGLYDCCTNAPITADAEDGWVFVNWTGTGITNPSLASTTVHIDDSKTVTAHFAPVGAVYLTTSSTVGGSVADPGEDTFPYTTGEVVDIVAERECGYVFLYWSGDVGTVADVNDAETTITMNDNYTIVANFASGILMEVDLIVDWNTFSTPIDLDPCISTWGDFMAFNDLDIDIVYKYNVTTKYWSQVISGDPVAPLEGYYVKMKSADTAYIVPNPEASPVPYKELSAGLNLIGLASLTDRDVVSTLTDVYEVAGGLTGYSRVHNPPINIPNDWVDNVYVRDDTYVPTMEVSKSYWVIMVNPGTLYGFTSTPLP